MESQEIIFEFGLIAWNLFGGLLFVIVIINVVSWWLQKKQIEAIRELTKSLQKNSEPKIILTADEEFKRKRRVIAQRFREKKRQKGNPLPETQTAKDSESGLSH